MYPMNRYLVEREIPGVGGMTSAELCGAARASCSAIEPLQPRVQWQHSYVAGDRTFCIYLADSEETIRKHSELSGIPAGIITAIPHVSDPVTANG